MALTNGFMIKATENQQFFYDLFCLFLVQYFDKKVWNHLAEPTETLTLQVATFHHYNQSSNTSWQLLEPFRLIV